MVKPEDSTSRPGHDEMVVTVPVAGRYMVDGQEKMLDAGSRVRVGTRIEVLEVDAPRSATIEIRDVRTDGFPVRAYPGHDPCYFWSKEGLIEGSPRIAQSINYDSFVTLEEAMEDPAEVCWEGRERGVFFDVMYWVPAAALEKAFEP